MGFWQRRQFDKELACIYTTKVSTPLVSITKMLNDYKSCPFHTILILANAQEEWSQLIWKTEMFD